MGQHYRQQCHLVYFPQHYYQQCDPHDAYDVQHQGHGIEPDGVVWCTENWRKESYSVSVFFADNHHQHSW